MLKANAMQYVVDNLKLRINGVDQFITAKEMYSQVIPLNFFTLYPFGNIKGSKRQLRILIQIAMFFMVTINWKKIWKNKHSMLMLMIAIIPYVRFIILANHSYRHFFFTYREQIITIIALGIILVDNFNYRIWFKREKNQLYKS